MCLLLCKEEGSSPVSAITERRDMGLYEVPLSMSYLGWGLSLPTCICEECEPKRVYVFQVPD